VHPERVFQGPHHRRSRQIAAHEKEGTSIFRNGHDVYTLMCAVFDQDSNEMTECVTTVDLWTSLDPEWLVFSSSINRSDAGAQWRLEAAKRESHISTMI
jgi:hypothetical protein